MEAEKDLTVDEVAEGLPERLCRRFGYLQDVWEESECPLWCLLTGNVFAGDSPQPPEGTVNPGLGTPVEMPEPCYCPFYMYLYDNTSHVTDAYFARAMVPDFLWQGRALWDDYALVKATHIARSRRLDIDGRRPAHVTRQRGMEGIWADPQGEGKSTFFDMYNVFVEFTMSGGTSETTDANVEVNPKLHDERASVTDFDTIYIRALNLRLMGLLLQDPQLTRRPHVCAGLYDPTADAAEDPLLMFMRDNYWPLYGHFPDELDVNLKLRWVVPDCPFVFVHERHPVINLLR
eukprot:CAMPEP_0173469274 /NCGR_PEP_ID=MMETSP1357-20121228/77278_1 /TAXON_ID=77926 /ORGANISM="Hemiselmis rufescens, Strain PCC563" /LENGTH=289 /DNA_ID=CAMNT_0014437511 /DNA_START=78 /DNA_END=948 /DNA_ORIENTATION=+